MTLFQVIRSLQTIALANPYIENAGDGSIYDYMNANPSIKYGVFFVSQTTHREDDYFDWFGFNLFVIDRLVDNLESNRLEIQSIAKEVLSNTIKTFVKKFLGVTHGEIRYTPFTQRFADLCAGQYCNIEFKIPKVIICEENFKEIGIIHDDCAGVYENGYRKGYEDGLNNCPECPDCPECSGYTQEDLDKAYDDGFESGVTEQKGLLITTAITENGTYSTENGYSSVVVNVPQTGYTQQDLDNAYNSGHTSGVTEQKALLSSTTITQNGTYTRADGYSAVTVNVSGYTQEDLDNAYQRGWNDGYQSGYTDGLNDCPECPDTGYSSQYLTIEALSDGTLYWKADDNQVLKTIEYSKNNGEWTSVTASSENSGATITTVVSGDLVRFRGNNTRYHDTTFNHYNTDITFKVYGNIMSLTYGDNFLNQTVLTGEHAFCNIFKLCTGLTDASNLILPATTLTISCYDGMFKGCTSLVTTPVLPATTLADYCYASMFRATSVNYVKCLATDISAFNCTETWLRDASATGTFVKKAGVSWTTGNSGIPSGWTVVEE